MNVYMVVGNISQGKKLPSENRVPGDHMVLSCTPRHDECSRPAYNYYMGLGMKSIGVTCSTHSRRLFAFSRRGRDLLKTTYYITSLPRRSSTEGLTPRWLGSFWDPWLSWAFDISRQACRHPAVTTQTCVCRGTEFINQ